MDDIANEMKKIPGQEQIKNHESNPAIMQVGRITKLFSRYP